MSRCKGCHDLYRKTDEMKVKRVQWSAAWNKRNPEKHRTHSSKWAHEHTDQRNAYEREYWESHRDQRTAKSQGYRSRKIKLPGSFTPKEFSDLKKMFAGTCVCCGLIVPLCADHIKPVGYPGSSNYIENIQPLCVSCNSSKGDRYIDYRPNYEDVYANL